MSMSLWANILKYIFLIRLSLRAKNTTYVEENNQWAFVYKFRKWFNIILCEEVEYFYGEFKSCKMDGFPTR